MIGRKYYSQDTYITCSKVGMRGSGTRELTIPSVCMCRDTIILIIHYAEPEGHPASSAAKSNETR